MSGNSAPWIFLRGLMRDSRHWGDFPAGFRGGMPDTQIVMLDLPGNGPRNREDSQWTIEAMAEWCRAELLRENIAPPYRLFAMSMGAMIAVDWAQRHPAELQAAVLVNTSLRPYSPFYQRLRPAAYVSGLRMALTRADERESEAAILRLTSRHHRRTKAVVDEWTALRRACPVSPANALRQLAAAARFNPPKARPPVPLLLLTSKRDGLVDTRCSQVLARHWGCEIAVHPTAGHDLPLDDGQWVVEQIAGWAARKL